LRLCRRKPMLEEKLAIADCRFFVSGPQTVNA
jgi:hypothetical protein